MKNTTNRIFTNCLLDIKSTDISLYAGVAALSATKTLAILIFALSITACTTDVGFTVNTSQDLNDLDPGDGVCGTNTAGSVCSLRAAIEEANEVIDSLRVQITVSIGIYELTLPGELLITRGRMTLSGAGQDNTIVDGLNQGRILRINGADVNQFLIEKLTLRNGALGSTERGGAVRIETTDQPYLVTFNDVAILDSRAGFVGGGIYAQENGVLNILNSLIAGNFSTNETEACNSSGGGQSGGGGIFANGPTVSIINSEIRDNCGSNGGGVSFDEGSNHLILRSTIANNRSMSAGGGVLFRGNSGGRIEDSTITGNRVTNSQANITDGSAAGLHVQEGTLAIISTTIVDNVHDFPGDHLTGGIRAEGGSVDLRNTVLADNLSGGNNDDCSGVISSSGGNFFGDGVACTFIGSPTDIVNGGNPDLGNLVNNGGITRTMLPNFGSPLINSGISGCEPIDQRGLAFSAPLGDGCDIGAVER